ncbi:MAG: septum site-determining protein MinC [Anaeromyxobacter sp. RBG_16_69_14]|nr:MAG: septum site-determining protein MinC [Anaeromyxobacter sp. RBG_16_69_14]
MPQPAARQSASAATRDAPFQLRGCTFTMMLLKILNPRDSQFFPLLADKVRQAPNFFRNAPVVLDLDGLPPEAELEFQGFSAALRRHGLIAVSLQGGTRQQQESALAAGLTLLAARTERSEAEPRAAAVERAPELPYQRTTKLVTEPVRSGRQIYAQNGDLVVSASVSPGAELLADGSIHVYGALRGRALAGASGDGTARIFCQSLEAELVSIAGLYLVSEDMGKDVQHRKVQVYIQDDNLHIDPMTV